MTSPKRIPIFDGHNDVLLRLHRRVGADAATAFLQGEDKGHLDLPKARKGGFAGGLFAIFVPSPHRRNGASSETRSEETANAPAPSQDTGSAPAPPAVDGAEAQRVVFAMASLLYRIEREVAGARSRLPQCRRYRKLPRRRRAGGGPSYRRRRSHRREF